MYSAQAASSPGLSPTHSLIGRPLPASKTRPSPLAISSVTRPAGSLTTSWPRVTKAKNFPALGSLSPLAESILPRSTPRRRLAAPSKIVSTSVLVMAAHPERATTVFVAALRDKVEVVVSGIDEVDPTRIGRVSVEHLAALVLGKDAGALTVRVPRGERPVVVDGFVLLLRREEDSVIVVEVVPKRRDPGEAPAHPLLVCLDLRERRSGDRDHRHVPMVQVLNHRLEVVGPERANRAAGLILRIEHEVVDEQLASAVEELGQGLLALRALEDVLLLDRLPGQGLPMSRQLVARAREFLLIREQLRALGNPVVVGDDVHMPSGPRSSPGSPPRPAITRRAR